MGDIERRRRRRIGWSGAPGEEKTAVVQSNRTKDILCENGESSVDAAKAGGKCGSAIPGMALSCWA